jgi:uncharacterized protein (TIGR03067 family)
VGPVTVRYRLDPTADPPAITTVHEIGPGEPFEQLGIYALNGDRLTLGIAGNKPARPTQFDARKGLVLVLERTSN